MNSRVARWLLAPVLVLVAGIQSLEAESLQGDIRFQARLDGPVWVGEQVELNLDLLSNGFSFSGQRFLLPEVGGAYLLQPDSSTVNLSENRNNEAWQGLRYTFLLYPQKAGEIEIPSFSVEFSVAAGYGSEPTAFQIDTPPVRIEVRLPPGVDQGELLTTTTDYTLAYNWSPAATGDDPLQLKTGDALTLVVDRSAEDVPAMVFSPLPDFHIEGLRAYADAPTVNDTMNRGQLVGKRTDRITFICEQDGQFTVPPVTFKWWDPEDEVMHEEVIAGLSLHVIKNAALPGGRELSVESTSDGFSSVRLLTVLIALLIGLWVGWKCWYQLQAWLRNRQVKREASESWAFKHVLRSCRSGPPMLAYQAINQWLMRVEAAGTGFTLLGLAQVSGDRDLVREVEKLQFAVAERSMQGWSGTALAAALKQWREVNQGQQYHAQATLPPLNPGGRQPAK